MKKLLLVACAMICALSLAACSDSSGSGSSSSKSSAKQQDYYNVVISGHELVTDNQGGSALVVAFDYTNNTKTPVSFMQAIPTAAAQDGVAIGQDAYVTGYVGSDGVTPDYMLKVEPGATATVHMAFALTSSNDVTVRCSLGFVDGGYPDPSLVVAEETLKL